jgi:signal transduction histidine kinase
MNVKNLDSTRSKVRVRFSRASRFASFVMLLVTVVVVAAVAYFTERRIVASRDMVIHTYEVRSQLDGLQLAIMRSRASQSSYTFTQQRDQLWQSEQEADSAVRTVDALRVLTRDNAKQQKRLDQLSPLLKQGISLIKDENRSPDFQVKLPPNQRAKQEEIVNREKQVDSLITDMSNEENMVLGDRLQTLNYLFKRNLNMLALAFAVMIIMLVFSFRLLLKEVARTREIEERERENAESFRLLSVKILELQDSERRRIARELHDSVGQFLAGLKISLSRLEMKVQGDILNIAHEALDLTDRIIQEVRTISHLLHPPLLEELGFVSAARWYMDEFGKRSDIKVSLSVDQTAARLPRAIEIALFRVLQEALTNVHRHAAARSVDIRIVCGKGCVSLTIADDGKGIPSAILAQFYSGGASGIGLGGMRQRLAELGGQITVESSGRGSVIHAVVPTEQCTGKGATSRSAAA